MLNLTSDFGTIILPKTPAGPDDADTFGSYIIPYTAMIQRAYAKTTGASDQFNLSAAQDPANNLKWQISTWYDTNHTGTDVNDFMQTDYGCPALTDIVPNTGIAAIETTVECYGDFNADRDVDGTDLFLYAINHGRPGGPGPLCP
jgi:hypothetical protein